MRLSAGVLGAGASGGAPNARENRELGLCHLIGGERGVPRLLLLLDGWLERHVAAPADVGVLS